LKTGAVAAVAMNVRGGDRLDPLRRRFAVAGGSSIEAVLVDFLEDDLNEAEDLVGYVTAYLAMAARRLEDPLAREEDLVALLGEDEVLDAVVDLGRTVENVRRRLAQVACRLASS
jgi:hypothetical protein